MPSSEAFEKAKLHGCPNELCPSDHLSLMADYAWLSSDDAVDGGEKECKTGGMGVVGEESEEADFKAGDFEDGVLDCDALSGCSKSEAQKEDEEDKEARQRESAAVSAMLRAFFLQQKPTNIIQWCADVNHKTVSADEQDHAPESNISAVKKTNTAGVASSDAARVKKDMYEQRKATAAANTGATLEEITINSDGFVELPTRCFASPPPSVSTSTSSSSDARIWLSAIFLSYAFTPWNVPWVALFSRYFAALPDGQQMIAQENDVSLLLALGSAMLLANLVGCLWWNVALTLFGWIQCRRRSSQVELQLRELALREFDGFYDVASLSRIAILEGFLRRLSACSDVRDLLVLRGSLTTRQFIRKAGAMRNSSDLDFLAQFPWDAASPEQNVVHRIMRVLSASCGSTHAEHHDGVFLNALNIEAKVTWADTELPGVKVTLKACSLYDRFPQDVTIDVAFGDPIQPPAFLLSYVPLPLFCDKARCPVVSVLCVKPELMFAWKLQGLFEHNTVDEFGMDVQGRWRPKDIHDLWLLAKFGDDGEGRKLDVQQLPTAIEVAFSSRKQDPRLVFKVLTQRFGSGKHSQRSWRNYRKKCVNPDEIPLQLYEVIADLAEFLGPVFSHVRTSTAFPSKYGGEQHRSTSVAVGATDAGAAAVTTGDERELLQNRLQSRVDKIVQRDAQYADRTMTELIPGLWTLTSMNRKVFAKQASIGSKDQRAESRAGSSAGSSPSELPPSEEWWLRFQDDIMRNGTGTTVQFLPRKEQFEVEGVEMPRVKHKTKAGQILQNRTGGCIVIRQRPDFTLRDCRVQVIYRRTQVDPRRGANRPSRPPLNLQTLGCISGGDEVKRTKKDLTLLDTTGPAVADDALSSASGGAFSTMLASIGLKPISPASSAENGVLAQHSKSLNTRLARRLDVLPPLQKIAYATSSQAKFRDMKKVMAEWQEYLVAAPGIKPPIATILPQLTRDSRVPLASLQRKEQQMQSDTGAKTVFFQEPGELLAAQVAQYCHSVLGCACVVDVSFLEVEDGDGDNIRVIDLDDTNIVESFAAATLKLSDQKAILRSFVAYCDGASTRVFEGALEGRIIDEKQQRAAAATAADTSTLCRVESVIAEEVWSRMFKPDGYDHVLGDLGSSGFCVHARLIPFLELAQSLRGRDYTQIFEVHVTVATPKVTGGRVTGLAADAPSPSEAEVDGVNDASEASPMKGGCGKTDQDIVFMQWRASCQALKKEFGIVKPVLIENASGEAPRQLMTASHHVGNLPEIHVRALVL